MVVLQDLVGNVDQLGTEDTQFLLDRHQDMKRVSDQISDEGIRIAVAAAQLESMSGNKFRLEIEEAIADMQQKLGMRKMLQRELLILRN